MNDVARALGSRGALALATGALLLLHLAVSLWPYEWAVARVVSNGAAPLAEGGVRFPEPGVALAARPPRWFEGAVRSSRLELWLRLRSLAATQSGPARILTLSSNSYEVDLMIGQEGDDLVVWLRTPWTDGFSRIDYLPMVRVADLFRTSDWLDLRITIKPGLLDVAVGDKLAVQEPLPMEPLRNWGLSPQLALGNEVTYNRPWLGEIRRATARAEDVAEDHADASQLAFPPTFLMTAKFPKLVPLSALNAYDAAANIVLYIPLGFLLALLGRGRPWRILLYAAVVVAAVSASMEVLQLFVPRRWPSVDDLIFNTIGGALGAGLALWAVRREAWAWAWASSDWDRGTAPAPDPSRGSAKPHDQPSSPRWAFTLASYRSRIRLRGR